MAHPSINLIAPDDRRVKPCGLNRKLYYVTDEHILNIFGELPTGKLDEYSGSLNFIYQHTFMALYYRNKQPRLAGGQANQAKQIHELLLAS